MSETTDIGRNPKNGQFVMGHAGNGGRKPGARGKLSTIFLDDLKSAWERHGADVLERVARDDPAALLRTVAMLMPKDINLSLSIDPVEFAGRFRSALEMLGNPEPLPKQRRSLRNEPRVIEHDG